MNQTNENLTFPLFLYEYAILEGWEVPEVHLKMAEFLDDYKNWNKRTGCIQAFRGVGKSTLVDLWIVYLLLKQPTLRIQINSADDATAKRTVSECRRMIQRIKRAEHLYNNNLWSASKFSVQGSTDGRNASVSAYGIMSNRTSSRADIVLFDDVEVPKNSKDPANRQRMRENLKEANFILVPGGTKLWVGTPHAQETVLNQVVDAGASSLFIPGMTDAVGEFPHMTGIPAWPERFGNDYIADLQLSVQQDEGGPRRPSKGHFYSQFLLIPTHSDSETFDATRLKYYDSEVMFSPFKDHQEAHLLVENEKRELVSVSCFFDPSRSDRGDDSVLAIIYMDEKGRIYIHSTEAVLGDMDEQVTQICELLKTHRVPLVCVETNGCGLFFPPKLIKELEGTGIGVDEHYSTENKNKRIHEAFNQPLLGRLLYCSEQVKNSKFVSQLSGFNPATRRNEDDFVDSVGNAILRGEPYMLGVGGGTSHIAVDTSWTTSRNKGTEVQMDKFSFGKRG